MAVSLESGVKAFAINHLGMQVGRGECADLAVEALKSMAAKSCANYGKVTPNADYVWGNLINVKSVQGGDILQFRDFTVTVTTEVLTVIRKANGAMEESTATSSASQTAGHHTSIVESVQGNGVLNVLEQNWLDPSTRRYVRKVHRNTIETEPTSTKSTKTTVNKGVTTNVTTTRTVTTSGKIWAYQPVPLAAGR